jgi:hypothetical protein
MRHMEKMTYQKICLFEWHKMLSEVTEDIKNKEHPAYLVTMRSHKNVRIVVKNRWLFRQQNDSSGGEHGN